MTVGPDKYDDLLVLDPQTEGAVSILRLRRGSCGGRQGKGAALGLCYKIHLLDYYYYTALAVAALYENASADEQTSVA